MSSLYDSLLYNWERGFYSVVKNKHNKYQIFSTKDPKGMLKKTRISTDLEELKSLIGEEWGESNECFSDEYDERNWKIVDTIHPSELMGKGFQVGDVVRVSNWVKGATGVGTVEGITDRGTYYLKEKEFVNWYFYHNDLKPVLPQPRDRAELSQSECTQNHHVLLQQAWQKINKEALGTNCPQEEVDHVSDHQKESNSIPLTYEVDTVGRLLKQCPTCYVKYSTKTDDSDYQEEQELNEPVLKELSDFTKSICDSMGSPTENLKENNQKLKAFAKRYFSKEEKKECEHAPADVKQGWVFNSLTSYPLWLCKCGLVTCKNPNE